MAYWYRHMWLGDRKADTFGTPAIVNDPFVKIMDTWDANDQQPTRSISVIGSQVASIRLLLNGKEVDGSPQPYDWGSPALFKDIQYAPGELTAEGLDASGKVLAQQSISSCSAPTGIKLRLDAPSPSTGTGTGKLVADGLDTALLAVHLVDDNGRLCRQASNNVSVRVASGPGLVLGMDSGDPASTENQTVSHHTAFHGQVRAAVRVTQVSAKSARELAMLRALHPESELALLREGGTSVVGPGEGAGSIELEVSADGISKSAQLSIDLSTDPDTDGVLAAASQFAAGANLPLPGA